MTLAESKAKRGGVAVEFSVPSELPMIGGDHHQLCQVFTNLLTNAFEALDGRGRIVISAMAMRRTGSGVRPRASRATRVVIVEVADDGPGVPAELNDRIFDPFFTTKPQGPGSGCRSCGR
jgi:signal transduction histidine kinase